MSVDDTNEQENSRRTSFITSSQYYTPLPKDTTTNTAVPVSHLTPELNYTTISCIPWHRSYDLQLERELELMILEENHISAVFEQYDYQHVSGHESPVLPPIFNTQGLGQSTYSAPQPPPLTFTLTPPVHDKKLSPSFTSAIPTYPDQPDLRPINTPNYCSSGTRQKREQKVTSVKRKLNPNFQCLHPSCTRNLGEARALNRHVWAAHREWAQENNVLRCEEISCPYPGCTRRGRKDNIKRHFMTRHKLVWSSSGCAGISSD
ncbi:hypothetical protein QBC36DRAFT_323990 [Triangularia setosa]|uniref:C2H2-type domain-containing protein n=1 Tax=Triangularia setosa TaxID=2587417 RepID=A0AAN7AA83_9PEZI|nr:hypothetical protein QBC36DRAFT_323990 [Podospora setosa]